MRGQIIEKSKGVWLIRIQQRDSNSKRKSFSETFRGTKSEADKQLTKKLGELDNGTLNANSKQTLGEYLDVWLETIAKPRLHQRTFGDYKDLMRLHVRDSLGNIKLSDLKAMHIQKLYGELQTEKKLAARRVRYVHAVLSSALRKAVELDILPRNVAKLVQLPKETKKEMDVLTEAECGLFLNALKGERLETMFSFALATGLRPEEYLALQWKDVDLEKKTASVRRAVIRLPKSKWYFSEPKTKSSRRTLPLPVTLIKELRTHRRKQNEERLKLGAAWQNHDLVFPSEVGTPSTHSNITQVYKRVLKNAELRTSLRLYDLRHSHATLLLKAGVHAKVVSERLGHSTIALTLDVYSHVLPSMQAEAAAHLETMLYRKTGT
ncbi:MAG: site-specific integrase [Pyrinomonadaceae bacterium]|nr:site-specific integrase [Pyrinomonadaceae bacterium]